MLVSCKLCMSFHAGRATYTDKLFKFRNGRFEDLLNDDINEHRDVANRVAGRSVACVDRKVTPLLSLLQMKAFGKAQWQKHFPH